MAKPGATWLKQDLTETAACCLHAAGQAQLQNSSSSARSQQEARPQLSLTQAAALAQPQHNSTSACAMQAELCASNCYRPGIPASSSPACASFIGNSPPGAFLIAAGKRDGMIQKDA